MKILLSGGGTLGSVTPLLRIYEQYKAYNNNCDFIWVGTKNGPEKKVVTAYNLPYYTIASGKLRRYFSFFNFIDVFKIIIGFWQSVFLLIKEKPNLLISAGGFVSVPIHYAAFCLGIPTWIHQQDIKVGLANKLMTKIANKITTVLRDSTQFFPDEKTEWIGNPVRDLSVANLEDAYKKFNLNKSNPVIFAFGGGTGSNKINKLIVEMLPHLPSNYQIIHLTGQERDGSYAFGAINTHPNYQVHNFFTDAMKDAYAIADIIIGRGGFGTITEIASISKPAILLPMPDTHQEENVKMLSKHKAAIILDERKVNGLDLVRIVKYLIDNLKVRLYLGQQLYNILPSAKAKKVIEIIDDIYSN